MVPVTTTTSCRATFYLPHRFPIPACHHRRPTTLPLDTFTAGSRPVQLPADTFYPTTPHYYCCWDHAALPLPRAALRIRTCRGPRTPTAHRAILVHLLRAVHHGWCGYCHFIFYLLVLFVQFFCYTSFASLQPLPLQLYIFIQQAYIYIALCLCYIFTSLHSFYTSFALH